MLNFAAGHDSSNLPLRSRFAKEAFLISGVSEWMKYKAVRLVATGVYPCKRISRDAETNTVIRHYHTPEACQPGQWARSLIVNSN